MEGLERFLEAQDSRNSGYETAIREIKYGISSLLEAKAYLEHPVLGARLREAVLAMTAHAGSETADDSGVIGKYKCSEIGKEGYSKNGNNNAAKSATSVQ